MVACSLGAALALGAVPAVAVGAGGDDAAVPAPLARALKQEVRLATGARIHATPNAVANEKRIEVPGSELVVVVWEEVGPDGSVVPMQAFSADGERLSGRVRENPRTIDLRYASFDPARGVPAVDPALRGEGGRTFVVQFHSAAHGVFREKIEAAGGKVLRVIPDNAFIVRLPGESEAAVRSMPFVSWVGPFHAAYKLDEGIRAAMAAGVLAERGETRYSIECFERGAEAQGAVSRRITALGGVVELMTPDQHRMEATLTPEQLAEVVKMDEVHFVDPWGGPAESDTGIVRANGGANFLALPGNGGFEGQGVSGQVTDSELRNTHQEYSTFGASLARQTATWGSPGNPHGTSAFSIVFARGANAGARGLLPLALQRVFLDQDSTTHGGGALSRLAVNQQLVNPLGSYRSVFSSNSWGNARTTTYTTISQEMDDAAYQTRLLVLQSQSNAGWFPGEPLNNSRPQAWAKNVVSVGAVYSFGTTSTADDRWVSASSSCSSPAGSVSSGPAADGRIKPDISFYNDCVFSANNSSDTSYGNFGGTSSATPTVAGYAGLFFQMWHEGAWAGRGGKSDVFASRADFQTAKAALINSAFQYNWLGGGANADITRVRQGWGVPNLQTLYALRNQTFIVDGDRPLQPNATHRYKVAVNGDNPLKITMAYADPAGTTSAATHRINDLSVRAISPAGVVYWGNNGLSAGLTSTSGGSSNTKDTVENVFQSAPASGVWTIEVFGDSITQDTVPGTAVLDANYSLWVTGGVEASGLGGAPLAWAVDSNGGDRLHVIDLSTGEASRVPTVLGFDDAEGLAFGPGGSIYAVGGSNDQLWDISRSPGTLVGPAVMAGTDAGLSYFDGRLFAISAAGSTTTLYQVNADTGSTTAVGTGASYADGLAIDGQGNAFASGFLSGEINLYRVNLTTGALTLVGATGIGYSSQTGLAFGSDGTLYLITSSGASGSGPSQIFTVNRTTGAAQYVADVTLNGAAISGFEDLTIDRFNAPSRMAIPAASSTFEAALTRGFHFTAPYNGTISGLRVPADVGAGAQNVEVVRLNAAPPTFPTTTSGFVSLGRFVNVPGTNVIPCEIPVKQGDIIGVLGARTANANEVVNGYSGVTTTFASSMRGAAVSLSPLGTQVAINSSAASGLFTGGGIPIARVEVYYRDGRNNLYLDADTAAKGANMVTAPLSTPLGLSSFVGELTPPFGTPVELGAVGNAFDGVSANPVAAELRFNYNIEALEFLYGGGAGDITVTATTEAGAVVDTFTQADTTQGQPGGPRTLAGPGIRRVRITDSTGGSLAFLDNVRITATQGCYANCDGSTTVPILNALDFSCFLQRYQQAQSLSAANQVVAYANCDGSTTVPSLNALDFSCFLNRYRNGCP